MSTNDEALKTLDEAQLAVLVENHRKFRSFLSKRVGSDALAEDLLQLGMKKALESPPSATESVSIVAWFYRILKNTLIDHYRSMAAEERRNHDYLQALESEGRTEVPAADQLEEAVCACMEGLIPTLKDNYAEVLKRVDLKGEPISQVASDLGLTENNLNVRLHRARQALKKSLERTCGTCTEHGCLNCTC